MASISGNLAAGNRSAGPRDVGRSALECLMVKRDDWAKKNLTWVPHEKEGFALGRIVDKGDDTVTVELVDTGVTIKVRPDDCQEVNPPEFDKIEDMADLKCLNEASILHNIRDRFYSDLIYTYSGLFCVVVNPYKKLPIYTEELIDAFKDQKRNSRPPHFFAIADAAYRAMLLERENQSILFTGESGAGKTENTKKVTQYLAHVAGATRHKNTALNSPAKGELELRLLQANPILEAFGNCKTVKNDNSSRFGKFFRINFDYRGYISGANIEIYLLDKSRTCRQAEDERTFHIFYQLLRGTSAEEKNNFLLESVENYNFLKNGYISLPNVNDADEFHNTVRSMKSMGFLDDEITSILRVVSSVMLFGNLQFSQEKKSDQAILIGDQVSKKICHLLGMSFAEFEKALLQPRIKIGREYCTKAQSKSQCEFAVEAMSKACYERMFKWLVRRINKSLDGRSRTFIGILDFPGFESCAVNTFEQLCINYADEKIVQASTNLLEYNTLCGDLQCHDLGISFQPTIDLIEKPMGILALLDEQCLFPQATDQSFVEKLVATHEKHPKFVLPEMRSKSDFAVIHYAGRVDYVGDEWLNKNKEPLNDNVVALLQNSTDPLVVSIWKDAEFAGMESVNAFGAAADNDTVGSVAKAYKKQIMNLTTTLYSSRPHFVACVIPNDQKKPGIIDGQMIVKQLRRSLPFFQPPKLPTESVSTPSREENPLKAMSEQLKFMTQRRNAIHQLWMHSESRFREERIKVQKMELETRAITDKPPIPETIQQRLDDQAAECVRKDKEIDLLKDQLKTARKTIKRFEENQQIMAQTEKCDADPFQLYKDASLRYNKLCDQYDDWGRGRGLLRSRPGAQMHTGVRGRGHPAAHRWGDDNPQVPDDLYDRFVLSEKEASEFTVTNQKLLIAEEQTRELELQNQILSKTVLELEKNMKSVDAENMKLLVQNAELKIDPNFASDSLESGGSDLENVQPSLLKEIN